MNIEELVRKHSRAFSGDVRGLRNAMTEQAEAFKGELQAYDGMVRELTKTVEDMQAAQSVPVVGEPDCYDAGLLNDFGGGNVEWWQDYIRAELARAHDFYASQWPSAITAAELATLREKAAEADELRKALLALKEDCQTSNDCQYGTLSTSHVARIVDAAIAQGKGE